MTAGDRIRVAVVSFAGSGLFPIAPGTAGSIAAALVALVLDVVGWGSSGLLLGLAAALALVTLALGPWIESHFREKDPSVVVLD